MSHLRFPDLYVLLEREEEVWEEFLVEVGPPELRDAEGRGAGARAEDVTGRCRRLAGEGHFIRPLLSLLLPSSGGAVRHRFT